MQKMQKKWEKTIKELIRKFPSVYKFAMAT